MFEGSGTINLFEDSKNNKESLEFNENGLSEIVDYVLKYRREFIGEGMTAKVFKYPPNKKLCIKVIDSETISKDYEFKGFNSLKEEGEFLLRISRLNRGKVKVPIPLASFSVKSENDVNTQVLVMETLDAVTCRSVLDFENELPEKFNIDRFMSDLRKFIDDMHSLSVHHRDLHAGNVMIDVNTGDPRIIDFGIGILGLQEDDDVYQIPKADGSIIRLPKDTQKIEELNRDFRKSNLLTKY